MFRTNWILGLVFWLTLAGVQGAAAQGGHPTSIRVMLLDGAAVPADVLERAQREAAALFARSNIPFTWVAPETCEGSCFVFSIVLKPMGDKSRDPRVLGIAPGTREVRGKLAYAFYERIRNASAELGMDVSLMLGLVMAHELGHLFLPYGAHSLAGIMRPSWDRAQVNDAETGALRFMSAQAAMIRERLQASASPIAHAR